MTQRSSADPHPAGLSAYAPCKTIIEHKSRFFDVAAVSLHIGKPERQRRLIHIPQHLLEELFMFLRAHT